MEPEHHNKIMIIVISLVVIVVIILAAGVITGRIGGSKPAPTAPADVTEKPVTRQTYIQATTGQGNSSITDPTVKSYIKTTSGTKKSAAATASGRAALSQATSGI